VCDSDEEEVVNVSDHAAEGGETKSDNELEENMGVADALSISVRSNK
jgi:hypothetical protein